MISRYSYVDTFDGKTKSNSDAVNIIQSAISAGEIDVDIFTLSGNQRLDVLSGQLYGSSDFWWVIAAASGIGWGLQLPAGTLIRAPKNIDKVFTLL
jgi:hypothetical protein